MVHNWMSFGTFFWGMFWTKNTGESVEMRHEVTLHFAYGNTLFFEEGSQQLGVAVILGDGIQELFSEAPHAIYSGGADKVELCHWGFDLMPASESKHQNFVFGDRR